MYNVIIHSPADNRELSQRVASVYAEAITCYIKNLRCPKEQKYKLLQILQEEVAK